MSLLIKILLAAAIVAALFAGEQYIEHRGYDRAKAEDKADQEEKARVASEALASDQRMQRLFNDKKASQQLAVVGKINNQLGVAREKIATLSGRVCLDADTVRVLNNIGVQGGEPGGTTAAQPASAPQAAATDRDVGTFIATCRAWYGEVNSQLDKILDIEDRRHPPPP